MWRKKEIGEGEVEDGGLQGLINLRVWARMGSLQFSSFPFFFYLFIYIFQGKGAN